MAASKVLIVYYSRSGTTRKVARTLAAQLDGDIEEITEVDDRAGARGYLRSLVQALCKQRARILPPKKDPSRYQLVVVGTPVWAGAVSAPVRTYLDTYANRLPATAFFCTMGGRGAGSAFAQMERLAGQAPRHRLGLNAAEIASGSDAARIADFAKALRAGLPQEKPKSRTKAA